MKIRKPSHTTIVAYLALFAALAGTAVAARDEFGAKDIKQVVVRKEKIRPGADGLASVVARCRPQEEFISGAGGWNKGGAPGVSTPILSEAAVISGGNGGPKGFIVRGSAPGQVNTLVAQALCLPK
jgi:hypothetical protein